MSSFDPTERRIDVTCRRSPEFPRSPALLTRLIRHLSKRQLDEANHVLKRWGINQPEYNLLMMLYGTEGNMLTPSELGEAAGEKLANITRLTNGLCERGLLQREPSDEDRRKISLSLSPQGAAMIDSLLPAITELLLRQTRGLGAAEQRQLEKLLKKLLAGLEG